MGSQFRISNRTQLSVIIKRTPVSLRKIICVLEDDTAEPRFEHVPDIIRGDLRDTPVTSGSMKHIYDVRILFPFLR